MADKSSSLVKGCITRGYEEWFLRDMIHKRKPMWNDTACKKLAGLAHHQPVLALRKPSHIIKVMRFMAAERGSGLVKTFEMSKKGLAANVVAM